ncbi:MAG TPA: hypothetical protein VHD36_11905 [Pirellulales bacterium]|nr:hypothetical protein [Pirellulales bacterium]
MTPSGKRCLRWLDAVVVLLALFFSAPSSLAAEREMHPSLAGQLRMVQLRIMSGRITAGGPASEQSLTSNYMGNSRREQLTIDLGGGRPSVNYGRFAPDERLSYQIENGSEVTIQLVPRSTGDHATVVFLQPAEGALRLRVATGEQSQTVSAPSLWHLLIIEPALCREHLLPLLEIMHPNWQLAQQAVEIENALCADQPARPAIDHSSWEKSLQQLTSDRFVERERAEQQLRGYGPVVLPFLRRQGRSELDPEQAFRVRRVIRSLAKDADEDRPDRVLPWLTGDPRIWYALLAREDEHVRSVAAGQLAKLLDAKLEFDPAAEPELRRAQRERLHERFGAIVDPPPPAESDAESE